MKILVASLGLLPAIIGCRTWARVEDKFSWKVVAPEKVQNPPRSKTDLYFRVEVRDQQGQPVEDVSFFWLVEWVGSHGWDHKGESFQDLDIRVKGSPGTAYIRIFAYAEDGKLSEVAKHPVLVE